MYVDGFVPVPIKNLKAYRSMARRPARSGASTARWNSASGRRRREARQVDVFPQSVKLEKDETVVFSWIVYKSRAHRDRVNAKVMKDKRLASMMDPRRCLRRQAHDLGGFKMLVEA